MITNIQVPIGNTQNGPLTYHFSGNNLDGFPVVFVGKDTYAVSIQNEHGLDFGNDYVYNVHIGKYCALAHDISFVININHDYNKVCVGNINLPNAKTKPPYSQKRKGQILIQNDVWIGRGVTIMAGVTIHNGAVVAANSLITKDVPPYSIVGGNPARHIKYRFSPEIIEKLLSIQWWNWTDNDINKNAESFSKDITTFTDCFYKKSPFTVPKLTLDIMRLPNQFLFFPDFNQQQFSTWENVIKSFCDTFADDENSGLILFFIKDGKENEKLDLIAKFAESITAKCSLVFYAGDENEEKAVFSYADYYITNRHEKTVYHSCLADYHGIRTISGVDKPVF